jgi:hypothetical protein
MVKLGGVGTPRLLIAILCTDSVPPVGWSQFKVFVTVRVEAWPATIVTGAEYPMVHVAPRPLHCSSTVKGVGFISVTEQTVPAASVPDWLTV